ncbi:MAG: DNA replication/repair protein RecF [Sphingobacteriaceae bacterium]|nr:DNA replication/repair protein RecF [Sphingobacteriaceae bacterium]
MFLKQLSLINFKNYASFDAEFSQKINCFVGNNGMGKTNLLDAIYYLSFCKSYFNAIDSQNIKHNEGLCVIQGVFNKFNEETEVYCGLRRNQKKVFRKNKKEYDRLSEHIGQFPLVMISPGDAELINGTSEERRKFLDSVIAQYDKVYLDKLVAYQQVIRQRNALLKQFAESRTFDSETIDIWDEQLVLHGKIICEIRQEFLKQFIPIFNKYYAFISSSVEAVGLAYQSSIGSKDYKAALMANLAKDRALTYTSIGPHKDDLEFILSGNSLKKFASQGQQKSYVLALKLAQYEFIKDKKNTTPLLLLDDVYDKLDKNRFTKLIELVSNENFGQVFITDSHADRMQQLFDSMPIEHKVFLVETGNAVPL